jgi:hypothetical protein
MTTDQGPAPAFGWRYFAALGDPSQSGRHIGPVLIGAERFVVTASSPPARDGYQLVDDLTELVALLRQRHPAAFTGTPSRAERRGRAPDPPVARVDWRGYVDLRCVAVARVRGDGHVDDGGDDDPPGARLVERLTIVGLHLAPRLAPHRRAFARRFRVPVTAGRGDFAAWLDTLANTTNGSADV